VEKEYTQKTTGYPFKILQFSFEKSTIISLVFNLAICFFFAGDAEYEFCKTDKKGISNKYFNRFGFAE
jgi:hypothetical protein